MEEKRLITHAHWQEETYGWTCSHCYKNVIIIVMGKDRTCEKKYCPNCGSLMDEPITIGNLDDMPE